MTVMTGHFNRIVLELTPLQRWDAVTRYHSSAAASRWVIILSIAVIAVLTVVLLVRVYRRQKAAAQRSGRQRIAPSARENPGFAPHTSPNTISSTSDDAYDSRRIPLKKKLYIKRNPDEYLEAIVTENTPAGLAVQFRTPVEIIFGQLWICRYYAGAYVAEFNTTAAKCNGTTIVLNHSNKVRLVNRRRFLRVPVNKPAYIANFPFKPDSPSADGAKTWFEPPRFVPATLTELGGPGLRIETELDTTGSNRVLLSFKLGPSRVAAASNRKPGSEEIIQGAAKVRHVIKKDNGSSIALEFADLNDDEIDELIRITNDVSIGMNESRRSYTPAEIHNP